MAIFFFGRSLISGVCRMLISSILLTSSVLWDRDLKTRFYEAENWFEVGFTLGAHLSYVAARNQLTDVLKWFRILPSKFETDQFVSSWERKFERMDGLLLKNISRAYEPQSANKACDSGSVIDLYLPIKKRVTELFDGLKDELHEKVIARNKEDLKELVAKVYKEKGPNCDLNFIDVSLVTDMSRLFHDTVFNGDISKWDVSNVTNMYGMFFKAWKFDGDVSRWNVSKVTDMTSMFSCASAFNGDISRWDVSNVKKIRAMFCQSAFAGDISRWKVADNLDMTNMFEKCPLKIENRLPPWYKETKEDNED